MLMDPDKTENPGLNLKLTHYKPKSSLSYRPQAAVKTGLKKNPTGMRILIY